MTFGGQRYEPLPEERRLQLFAEIMPWLRGQLSIQKRVVGTVQDDPRMLKFVNSVDGPRLAGLGTSCPDHFLRTKIKPLFVEWDPHAETIDELKASISAGLAQYRDDYKAYYERCRREDSPAALRPATAAAPLPKRTPAHPRRGRSRRRGAG